MFSKFQTASLFIAGAMVFALLYLGAQPKAVNLFPEPWDKVAHFFVFGCLAALFCISGIDLPPAALIGLVTLIGVIDELHQSTLPGRSADVADLATDFLAAACVVFAAGYIKRRHRTRQRMPSNNRLFQE